ncbi:MAG: zf-HC2 domain-containing protein [Anaeromyxobacter sp.]
MTAARHPSPLAWARHLAREAGPLERLRMRRHLAGCAACRAEAEAAERERAAFEAAPPPLPWPPSRAPAAARPRPPRAWRWFAGAAGLATAAVAIVLVWTYPGGPSARMARPGPHGPAGTLASAELAGKGGDAFALWVQRPGGPVPLGARCAAGDRLMAGFRTARPWLLLLERDGLGNLQVLYPPNGTASAPAPASGTSPASFVLDAVPGRECFAAVFSDAPIPVPAGARALGTGERTLLPDAAVRVLCCDKEAAR